jgi:hypothetical protein
MTLERAIVSSEDEPTDVLLDISKYEGHTRGPWFWSLLNDEELTMFDVERAKPNIILRAKEDDADAQLIADAPLLLEEVKRLRAEIAGIDALVLETYECVQNSVAPFGWESYLMKRFNLIAEHLGLLKNASE